MYMPKSFQETDRAMLHQLMQTYSFATLITQADGIPYASHVPLLLRPDDGPHGTLVGHLARANPQWQHFDAEREVLVIFQGRIRMFPPHGMLSIPASRRGITPWCTLTARRVSWMTTTTSTPP